VADKKPFLLRLQPELYEALAAWAEQELRSMNGQLEFLLREALARAGRLPSSREGGGSAAKRRVP
jgi:hypothetical protein